MSILSSDSTNVQANTKHKEHFSTPLHFAIKHFGLEADIKPFPTGTGALTASLKDNSIDVAIGLTEGFVADLGKTNASKETPAYKLVGTYVESPLCWAISVGNKSAINNENELNGKRVGVSRIGSGSYVMSYVLADQKGWLEKSKSPFEVVPLGDFKALRNGVNEGDKADFFMWEHVSYTESRETMSYTDLTHLTVHNEKVLRQRRAEASWRHLYTLA